MAVEDLTSRHLKAIRDQHEMDREILVRLGTIVARLSDRLGDLDNSIRAMDARLTGSIKDMDARSTVTLNEVRSDIVLLENHNISRHGEVISILRRLDNLESVTKRKPRVPR